MKKILILSLIAVAAFGQVKAEKKPAPTKPLTTQTVIQATIQAAYDMGFKDGQCFVLRMVRDKINPSLKIADIGCPETAPAPTPEKPRGKQ